MAVTTWLEKPSDTVTFQAAMQSLPDGSDCPGAITLTIPNVGTNRWAFRPEFAVFRPLGQRWLLDLYSGLWLFTSNHTFYPGTASRSQAPMGSFQAHVSYNFTRQSWAAIDTTYYVGGRSAVDGVENDDRQNNVRVGSTLVLQVGRRQSVKLAVSRGAIVRAGTDFTTISIGWQTAWLSRWPLPRQPGE